MLGGIGGRRRRGRQRMGWLGGMTNSMDVSSSGVMDREAWRAAIYGVAKSPTRLSDCTEVLAVIYWSSLVAQRVKRLPAMQETWVRSLGQEDPLEKEMATHSSTLAWKIPSTEKPGRL